jgi:hypothetical protein
MKSIGEISIAAAYGGISGILDTLLAGSTAAAGALA